MLSIQNLHAEIENKQILNGVNLELVPGKIHVLMGPNGSGKSTLAKALMGHPAVEISRGTIMLDGSDITDKEANERSLAGIYMAFQYPTEVPGVNFSNFLRLAYNARASEKNKLSVFQFRKLLKEKAAMLEIDESMLDRNLNEGLSGGEKKKSEILQLALLKPKYAILDETDSGLDIDALKTVFSGVQKLLSENKNMGVLVITHYQRIFDYIVPDTVHVMKAGKIFASGGLELIEKINRQGYKE